MLRTIKLKVTSPILSKVGEAHMICSMFTYTPGTSFESYSHINSSVGEKQGPVTTTGVPPSICPYRGVRVIGTVCTYK